MLTATNKPVRPGTPGATLREDLYYRLAVFEIEVPCSASAAATFPCSSRWPSRAPPARAVSEDAMSLLSAYEWPGNVRELLHVIRRAAAMCGGEIIDTPDLPPNVRPVAAASATAPPAERPRCARPSPRWSAR